MDFLLVLVEKGFMKNWYGEFDKELLLNNNIKLLEDQSLGGR